MGDDYCRPHKHFGRECIRHHAYPRDGEYYCPGCGRRTQSITTADAARKLWDQLDR